ncbi:hypothetical protein BDV59DRAFT_204911 [Aspergillus ambiguus]|uniref:uncharacterized protein n=1 Tax=Aspergillus ambiguus TaxID=176160 RepID=UPI003CCD511D
MLSPRSFLLCLLPALVVGRPWIVTDLYQATTYTNDYLVSTTTVTDFIRITPTATALPEPLSTITEVQEEYRVYGGGSVTVVEKIYPTGVGEPADEISYNDFTDYIYQVNLTYTAPTSCSSQWTSTVAAQVFPPRLAKSLLPHTAVTTSVYVDTSYALATGSHTYTIIYVDPTQVPTSTLESLSLRYRPTDTACSTTDSYYNYYDDYYDRYLNYNWFLDDTYMGITPLGLTLALSIGWIGLFVLLGFLEAWIRFRRLMTGWQTRRGLPVCWALTVLPVSLLLLFCFKKGYRARSQPDAEILQRRWHAMSAATKLRLFFLWGFRYAYPPVLGPAPARVKASKNPGKNPGPRLLEPSPPRSPEPEPESEPEPRASVPEMAGVVPAPAQSVERVGGAQ